MSELKKYSYCSYCGHRFQANQEWPRRCAHCHEIAYRNPVPVSVVLIPVDGGLLVVRRNLDPGRGRLALPGGFIELPETWQEAGAREVLEEAGIVIDAQRLTPFRVYSAPDGTLLIFGLAPPWTGSLPPFLPGPESSERLVIGQPMEMAFTLHSRVVAEYFQEFAGLAGRNKDYKADEIAARFSS